MGGGGGGSWRPRTRGVAPPGCKLRLPPGLQVILNNFPGFLELAGGGLHCPSALHSWVAKSCIAAALGVYRLRPCRGLGSHSSRNVGSSGLVGVRGRFRLFCLCGGEKSLGLPSVDPVWLEDSMLTGDAGVRRPEGMPPGMVSMSLSVQCEGAGAV